MTHFNKNKGALFTNTSKKRAKKQGFETLSSKKEEPGAVLRGLGRRPILNDYIDKE